MFCALHYSLFPRGSLLEVGEEMFEIGHSLGILTFLRLLIQILAAFW